MKKNYRYSKKQEDNGFDDNMGADLALSELVLDDAKGGVSSGFLDTPIFCQIKRLMEVHNCGKFH